MATPEQSKQIPPQPSFKTGKVESNQSQRKQFWLAKLPNKLAHAWEQAQDGQVVGTITFTKGGVDPQSKDKITQSLNVSVDPSLQEQELPMEYTIEGLTKNFPNKLFSMNRHQDGSVDLNGSVARICNVQMTVGSKEYRNLCRNRLLSTVARNRYVKSVDVTDLMASQVSKKQGANNIAASIEQHGKMLMEAKQNQGSVLAGKKRKFENMPVKSVIFELFSTKPYWTAKDLKNHSGVADADLRPLLTELCDFHRSGENKGTWELKKEFQRTSK